MVSNKAPILFDKIEENLFFKGYFKKITILKNIEYFLQQPYRQVLINTNCGIPMFRGAQGHIK